MVARPAGTDVTDGQIDSHLGPPPTRRPTDLPTYRPADLPTYRPTDLPTYRPLARG